MRILGLISARSQSKGVKNKNIREVAGRPLIAWTIQAAQKSKYIDRLILSSDSEEIINVASQLGCEAPFIRPSELALDDTPGVDVVVHALKQMPGYDLVVLLQPTSPLRRAQDIDECLEFCIEKGSPVAVSVVESDKNPHWMFYQDTEARLKPVLNSPEPVLRRQDAIQAYAVNGAVYVARCPWLLESKAFLTKDTVGYVMPKSRSLDIDTEWDLKLAHLILTHNKDDHGNLD